MTWLNDLHKHNKKYFSQAGEDGILEFIFQNIGTTNKFCVEFGAGDGVWLSNTKHFLDNGWAGLLMDYNGDGSKVKKEFISKENINKLFKKYKAPQEFDLLSIDIDGNDYWVWQELKHQSRVVIIEFNGTIPKEISKTIVYNENHMYNHNDYYGASFLALKKLGESKEYSLICQVNKTNLIFVKNELLNGLQVSNVEFQSEQYHKHDESKSDQDWVFV
jgi:hypothetical protein